MLSAETSRLPVLRRQLRRLRRALSQQEQREHAAAVAKQVQRSGLLRAADRIAIYRPVDGELDPWPLVERVQHLHQWYLPVVRRHPQGRLWFVQQDAQARLRPNRFGILEPTARGRKILPPQALNLVLVPLVGFDPSCHRLGMGAGFYDRSLGFLRTRTQWMRPKLLGLAHECQKVDALTPQPWDLPLDAVVTESSIYLRHSPRTADRPGCPSHPKTGIRGQ